MIDIFSYKIAYFIIALLLGFTIGYFLRKGNYEKKIQEDIRNKEEEYNESQKALKKVDEQLFETKNRAKINEDLVLAQQDILNKLNISITEYKKKILLIQNHKEDLTIESSNIENEIEEIEKKLEKSKERFKEIEEKIQHYNNIKLENEELTETNKKIEEALTPLKEEVDMLKKNYIDLENLLNDKNKIYKTLQNKLKIINQYKNLLLEKPIEKIVEEKEKLQLQLLKAKYDNDTPATENIIVEESNIVEEKPRIIDKFLSKFKK